MHDTGETSRLILLDDPFVAVVISCRMVVLATFVTLAWYLAAAAVVISSTPPADDVG